MVIPEDKAAKVMFLSDRTCCVCRQPGKPCQIHHMDGNKKNNDMINLCTLCLECHNQTQISGGFNRKLNAEQILLYRDDWYKVVAQSRARVESQNKEKNPDLYLKRITTSIEVFNKKRDFVNLAIIYEVIKNMPLRDKYIELALKSKQDDETIVFLRSLQKKTNLIPQNIKRRLVETQFERKDFSQLARTYLNLGDNKGSIKNYCKTIIQDIEGGNLFSAAFYLKELCKNKLYIPLFEEDYKIRIKEKDIYWQIRCLEELGWYDIAREVLIKNRKIIEKTKDHPLDILKEKLYLVLKDEKKFINAVRINAEKYEI